MVVVLPPALLLSIEIERLLLQLVWVVFCTRAWTDTAPWPSRALPLAARRDSSTPARMHRVGTADLKKNAVFTPHA